MFMLPNVYSSKHNLILLKHENSGAFEVWSPFGRRPTYESGFVICYQPKVTKVQWLLLMIGLDPNGSQMASLNQQHYLLEARQKCRPLGLTPALLNQNMYFNKIQETCITLKLEKQWVSIWICQLRNLPDSPLGVGGVYRWVGTGMYMHYCFIKSKALSISKIKG